MKKILLVFTAFSFIAANTQTLKTFTGQFSCGKTQYGSATYTYYEDSETHEYVKKGLFNFSFNGKGDYQGYNQTVRGSFNKEGLKTGLWSYNIVMTDYGTSNPYYTGTVTLTANYKDGYANGPWKEVISYKTRKKYYLYSKLVWEPYTQLKTTNITMNFKEGNLVNGISINDQFTNFSATGSYDDNSLCIGTWTINDAGWGMNRELVYKDNFLYELIPRDNQGKVNQYAYEKYQSGYDEIIKAKAMSLSERENKGIAIDTLYGSNCMATKNIIDYINKLLSNDYFLYSFIGGDLTYEERAYGGGEIKLTKHNYKPLIETQNSTSNQDINQVAYQFKQAEEFLAKGDTLNSLGYYSIIDLNELKPQDRVLINDRVNLLTPIVKNLIVNRIEEQNELKLYCKALEDSFLLERNWFEPKLDYIHCYNEVLDVNDKYNFEIKQAVKNSESTEIVNIGKNYYKVFKGNIHDLRTKLDSVKSDYNSFKSSYNAIRIQIVNNKEKLDSLSKNISNDSKLDIVKNTLQKVEQGSYIRHNVYDLTLREISQKINEKLENVNLLITDCIEKISKK